MGSTRPSANKPLYFDISSSVFGLEERNINLVPSKTLSARREQLLEFINKDGTYLPQSVLHADLDLGMLEFVKTELKTTVSGKDINVVDKIITNQRWSQFTETWNFKDPDFNVQLPFITVVRQPEVKYGTNPSTQYTIPNRKQFFYAMVPNWDNGVKGMDVYTIPQPVPVDIKFSIKIRNVIKTSNISNFIDRYFFFNHN